MMSKQLRKSGFLAAFEQIASGKSQRPPSFAEQAQEQWKRLTSYRCRRDDRV
jgi:hypothetical protein